MEVVVILVFVIEEVVFVMFLLEEIKLIEEIVVGGVFGEEELRGWWESVKSWVGV